MGRGVVVVSTLAVLVVTSPARAQQPSCALSGTVVSEGGFVSGAEVSVGRFDKASLTDSAGRFRLAYLPCDRLAIQVRKIGFTVLRDTVIFGGPAEISRTFTMISVAQLDTVRTKADEIQYQVPRLQDFEARRKKNVGGYFIGEADLRKLEGVSLPSIMRGRFPGLQFTSYRSIEAARAGRSGSMNGDPPINPDDFRSPRGCWVAVFVDGILLFDGLPKKGELPPDIGQVMTLNLSGVEYYSGASAIPLQFKTTHSNCGTLLLWTRGR